MNDGIDFFRGARERKEAAAEFLVAVAAVDAVDLVQHSSMQQNLDLVARVRNGALLGGGGGKCAARCGTTSSCSCTPPILFGVSGAKKKKSNCGGGGGDQGQTRTLPNKKLSV